MAEDELAKEDLIYHMREGSYKRGKKHPSQKFKLFLEEKIT